MSINRDMQSVVLQVKTGDDSSTGAKIDGWIDYKTIRVAIYKTNDMAVTQSVKYRESTHTGLTYEREIKESECRLVDKSGTVYEITSADTSGRLTGLLMKVVDTSG